MNTPGHAIVNLLVLGNRERSSLFAPIALGAMLPDLPMFVFYLYERTWLGTPERTIWSESYFELGWPAKGARGFLALILACYGLYITYALVVWV